MPVRPLSTRAFIAGFGFGTAGLNICLGLWLTGPLSVGVFTGSLLAVFVAANLWGRDYVVAHIRTTVAVTVSIAAIGYLLLYAYTRAFLPLIVLGILVTVVAYTLYVRRSVARTPPLVD